MQETICKEVVSFDDSRSVHAECAGLAHNLERLLRLRREEIRGVWSHGSERNLVMDYMTANKL